MEGTRLKLSACCGGRALVVGPGLKVLVCFVGPPKLESSRFQPALESGASLKVGACPGGRRKVETFSLLWWPALSLNVSAWSAGPPQPESVWLLGCESFSLPWWESLQLVCFGGAVQDSKFSDEALRQSSTNQSSNQACCWVLMDCVGFCRFMFHGKCPKLQK